MIEYGMKTHPGAFYGDYNEDGVFALQPLAATDASLFCVIDGEGTPNTYYNRDHIADITWQAFITEVNRNMMVYPVAARIARGFLGAHDALQCHIPPVESSLLAAVVEGYDATLYHAGNCLAYRVTDTKIERLITSHNAMRRWIEAGSSLHNDVSSLLPATALSNGLGFLDTDLFIESAQAHFNLGDSLLLCSDGLYRYGDEYGIGDYNLDWVAHMVRNNPPQAACDRLIIGAQAKGGDDNISVIVVRFN